MDGRKETRDHAAELERLLDRLGDLSVTLPEAASIRSRILDLLGMPGPDEDASGAPRSNRGPPQARARRVDPAACSQTRTFSLKSPVGRHQ
jgi:hypothetical protein